MRKYDIYELMSEYRDIEFAPEKTGTEAVGTKEEKTDIAAVRKLVGKKIKLPHKHIKLKALAIAAAVVITTCVGTVIIASPNSPTVMYVDMLTVKNVRLEFGYGDEYSGNYFSEDHSQAEKVSPVELRDDRLWFVADGQEFDLTDMIDMETAYIYKTVNPKTKLADWVIIGGTPEYYMYCEFFKYGEGKMSWQECTCEQEFCEHDQEYITSSVMPYLDVYVIDGVEIPSYELTEEELKEARKKVEENTGEVVQKVCNAPWMASVADEFNFLEPNFFTEGYVWYTFGDGK